jgi:hypothetical protein
MLREFLQGEEDQRESGAEHKSLGSLIPETAVGRKLWTHPIQKRT